MRVKLLVLILILLQLEGREIFASDPPVLSSPNNNSTNTSSKLQWQTPSYTLYSSSHYRIQVDDNPSFPSNSINKDYYTNNTYYTPTLSLGTWYWRVKAKDASGAWSNWSNVWSFTLIESTPPPTPAPTPTPTATPISYIPTTPPTSFTSSNLPAQDVDNQNQVIQNPTIAKNSTYNSPLPNPTFLSAWQIIMSRQKANNIATVAGVNAFATPAAKVELENQKQFNPFLSIGLVLVFAGAFSLGYIYLQKK